MEKKCEKTPLHCAPSECDCGFWNTEEGKSFKLSLNSGEYSINDARASVGLPEVPPNPDLCEGVTEVPDAGITPGAENFLVLMQRLPVVIASVRAGFLSEGVKFAQGMAELAPYMKSLTPDQERVFLASLEVQMDTVNGVIQEAMESCFAGL